MKELKLITNDGSNFETLSDDEKREVLRESQALFHDCIEDLSYLMDVAVDFIQASAPKEINNRKKVILEVNDKIQELFDEYDLETMDCIVVGSSTVVAMVRYLDEVLTEQAKKLNIDIPPSSKDH